MSDYTFSMDDYTLGTLIEALTRMREQFGNIPVKLAHDEWVTAPISMVSTDGETVIIHPYSS